MLRYYAYIRVSTQRQGEKGVSLQEQRAAIARYAVNHNLQIAEWFEERVTAAKSGRPLFAKMVKALAAGKAHGVIIHKIDRGARNLRDWSQLGDLIDSGVSVHFVNESIDLSSRGGRLSADIQAVVASDYIRNLREETIKGMYGRLKQGLYPWKAPLGYIDQGGGKVKAIDPVRAPLVRQAFELYASGRHSLETLTLEMSRRGIRNERGQPLSVSVVSRMLNNPFYIGLIRIRSNGQTYQGRHTAIVPPLLFRCVRERLQGTNQVRIRTHNFTFRGLFTCEICGRNLIGEFQKGHTYYRCHAKGCPTKTFREEALEQALFDTWPSFAPSDEWRAQLRQCLEDAEMAQDKSEEERMGNLAAQLEGLKARLTRLIDVFVDGGVDKNSFEMRKQSLLEEQALLADAIQTRSTTRRKTTLILEALELACTAQQSYRLASTENKRALVLKLSSNRTVRGNQVRVEPHFPLGVLANRARLPLGDPDRDTSRTDTQLAKDLLAWADKLNPLKPGDSRQERKRRNTGMDRLFLESGRRERPS